MWHKNLYFNTMGMIQGYTLTAKAAKSPWFTGPLCPGLNKLAMIWKKHSKLWLQVQNCNILALILRLSTEERSALATHGVAPRWNTVKVRRTALHFRFFPKKPKRPQASLLPAGETVITNPQGAQHLGSHSREKPLYEITHKCPTKRWEETLKNWSWSFQIMKWEIIFPKSWKSFPHWELCYPKFTINLFLILCCLEFRIDGP